MYPGYVIRDLQPKADDAVGELSRHLDLQSALSTRLLITRLRELGVVAGRAGVANVSGKAIFMRCWCVEQRAGAEPSWPFRRGGHANCSTVCRN